MESSSVNMNLARRRVLGIIGLIIFSVAFIFACMYKVLPIGRIVLGTFGYMAYPFFFILALISLAVALGFSYSRSIKATVYFLITALAVMLFVQTLTTFKILNSVVTWNQLVSYLDYSYTTKITMLGSFGSLVCGLISMPLGAMGAVVVTVLFATLFGGLFIDYQFYGKYEAHVKKIKTRSVREKIYKSDKKKAKDGSPLYSFSDNKNSDVVGEITIDENEINSSSSIYENISSRGYTDNDVLAEITNDDIMQGGKEMFEEETTALSSTIQTKNNFTNDIYSTTSYPGVEISDKDEHRREFMSATFGSSFNNPPPTMPASEDYFSSQSDVQSQSNSDLNFGMNNSNDQFSSSSIFGGMDDEDELSKILNSSEDDLTIEPNLNPFASSSSETMINGWSKPAEQSTYASSSQNYADNQSVFGDQLNKTQEQKLFDNKNSYEQTRQNVTISSTHPIGAEPVVVPPKQPAFGGFKTSMQNGFPGLRYNAPPLNLLKAPKADKGDYTAEQNRKSNQLEQVLQAFNVPAKVKNIVRGPKITRYELSVPLGVSVKKIPTYEDDIAAALAAKTIVIKAPIPGSPYVGIELENDTFTSVYERELLESEAFQNCKDPLPIAIGKDISGEIVVKSLAKMVHLLIAGSTGSGKSVFMHNIILSLVYKSSPDDLRLIMIDPKKVEFNRYNGIPHLLTPEVVAGSEKAINAFKWCVKEMERRYDLMSKAGYNNIEPYNKSELVKAGQFEKFPYIVIVVDELAEIMAVNKKDVELCIQRLTQLARACGMHLIVATQRPSVDIITGVIKNNIPSRIAFSLQSGIDSKTILNATGAEKLLGQGDMIFAPTGTSATPRLQASYATDDEIKHVIDYIKKNNPTNFDESINNIINAEEPETAEDIASGGSGFMDAPPPKDVDSYFKTAVKLVMANGGASVSYLQRRLQIGYSRAARIIDQMEDKGFIAPSTGAKLRKVLITPDQFREEFGDDYDSIND